jgi:hypothetical protein
MSEREGRKFFFLLQAILAALFLIVGVALAIEAASGGYGIGLVIVTVMANGPGLVFFILAALSAATAMHYFGGAVRCDSDAFAAVKPVNRDTA